MSFWRVAHRGAAGSCPEHTRPAFERAIELGVDMIEMDIQLTRDRLLVVLHDREFGRTVSGAGRVRDCDLADLCSRDAGAWFDAAFAGERVLSLEDVLELTAGRAALNLEIKSPPVDWEATAAVLVDALTSRGLLGSTVVSCFDMGALRCVRARAPAARLGVLWQQPDLNAAWSHAAELGASSIHLFWGLIDPAAVSAAHQRGLSVIAWTVNEVDMMDRLVSWGVDGIISDFPERFSRVTAPA